MSPPWLGSPSARRTSSTWAARSCARSRGATTACGTATCRAGRARTSATRSRRRAAAAGPWAARTAYNRGQILYRAAEALESRGDDFGAWSAPRSRRRRDRRARALRGLDRQAAAGARRGEPRGGAVPVLLAAGADRRGRHGRARGARAARAGGRAGAGAGGRQHGRGGAVGGARRWRARPGRGAGRLGRAGRGGEPALGPARGAGGGAGRAPGPERDRRRVRATPSWARRSTELAAESVTRVSATRLRRRAYEDAVADALGRLEAVTELKTAWHPVGA